ncbi:hypothetical protein AVEN_46392-1 [Araneus ventricosus]|uniref:Rho termination factor-like N-terminal domain-containing protein n=1 Tax=Araneus ventricosus TaxID=182803 RepID=A0A4Y2JLU6_ARAVE|nr:hypothetical protein AVEN_46392-1 [Araneus ventricosus]
MESKTVQELKNYCRENNIQRYSKLKKSELVDLIQNHNGFSSFHNELFSKPKKKRELKIRCCGMLYKESNINKHLQTKAHQNYKPKKATTCQECGKDFKKGRNHSDTYHRDDFNNMQRLHRMTINQLREFYQTRGITGYSKLRRKAEIIAHIESELFNRHFEFDSDLFSDSRERRLYTPMKLRQPINLV